MSSFKKNWLISIGAVNHCNCSVATLFVMEDLHCIPGVVKIEERWKDETITNKVNMQIGNILTIENFVKMTQLVWQGHWGSIQGEHATMLDTTYVDTQTQHESGEENKTPKEGVSKQTTNTIWNWYCGKLVAQPHSATHYLYCQLRLWQLLHNVCHKSQSKLYDNDH